MKVFNITSCCKGVGAPCEVGGLKLLMDCGDGLICMGIDEDA